MNYQARLAKLEALAFTREMERLRTEYHRIRQAGGDDAATCPVIDGLVRCCMRRGLIAPWPVWFYTSRADTVSPERMAYVRRRLDEFSALIRPWLLGRP